LTWALAMLVRAALWTTWRAFADRITFSCEQPDPSFSGTVELGPRLKTAFNAGPDEIKVAHLRISVDHSPWLGRKWA